MRFLSLQEVTEEGVCDNVINFDLVRRISYDNFSDVPAIYIVYNTGVTQRLTIASRSVYDDLINTLFILGD